MKVEVIKCLSHSVELNFGEISVCITTADAENLIAQLRAVVPIPSDVQEAADSVAITKSMDYVDGIPDGGTREHPWNDHDVERGYQAGFRDGIGWERERLASCPTFKGWVARDMFGDLNVFIKKPTKFFGKVWSDQTGKRFGLSESLFPDLKWEDEPKKVSVTIKAE